MLKDEHKNILDAEGFNVDIFKETWINQIASGEIPAAKLLITDLVEFLEIANALYRAGQPIITDADYDSKFVAVLKNKEPQHPYLQKVEPEPKIIGKTIALPKPMLSTDKAYSINQVQSWLSRIKKSASEIDKNFDDLVLKITPKLDGFAAYDDGKRLYTRGNGKRGTDISRVFERGLVVGNNGKRGLGAGEIVVDKKYFKKYLSDHFENARNFQASVVKEKDLEIHAEKAIQDKAAVFYPFALLPSWHKKPAELEQNFDEIVNEAWNSVDYDIDGVVIEVVDENLKNHMGNTRNHFRWQLAFKRVHETADVEVLKIIPQTSRSGRVNPVLEIQPTRLSGAMIHRVTAHHYNMVKTKMIGPGAIIELTRSGEVIPKINEVKHSADVAEIPECCPSCGSELVWDGDFLFCLNITDCPAQITNTMEHFFKTLGNVDGFGPANITKMYEHGVKTIPDVYSQNKIDFERMGFGVKQAENLLEQLKRSQSESIEDWRFLAAFGVKRMGGGNCERLLENFDIRDIFNLASDDIIAIEGFALKTAEVTVKGLHKVKSTFEKLIELGFNLEKTKLKNSIETKIKTPISGFLIVFSGTMRSGSRDDMEAEAKKLGAKIAKSVSSKTNLLVIGENVGEKKLTDAKKHNVRVLTEDEYFEFLNLNVPKLL